ncbi:MAG: dihydrofolate reductase, partial [Candidatus Phytoplasma sp.]|nr:dihydrofolate reductase [Phytoplasma sp.]
DETALIESLNKDKFLGVALDVFEEEPLKESPLWDFENVIITPHNSFVSDKVNERLFEVMIENLR